MIKYKGYLIIKLDYVTSHAWKVCKDIYDLDYVKFDTIKESKNWINERG